LQKRLEFAFLGGRFWVFAEIGALMVVVLTFKPYFIAYNVTALVVIICALAWDFWRNAPKNARYGMALIPLAAFVFLLYNGLAVTYGWPAIHHPAEAAAVTHGVEFLTGLAAGNPVAALTGLGEFSQSVILAAIAYAAGGVASLLFLVSGLMGLMAARRA